VVTVRELFKAKNFRPDALDIINLVNSILDEYAAGGYLLTLRQVYYQLVARGHIPNSIESYKRIGDVVSDGRMAGLIDWAQIEDRARETVTPAFWDSPADILRACAAQYRTDWWITQPYHVEVLVEKQALEGILEPVARRFGVPFTANKGYLSQSMMYQISKRLLEHDSVGKDTLLLYLGDHDPSGLDMDRDIRDRLKVFTGDEFDFEVRRLALTRAQIDQYNPPENPAKISDSRATAYIAQHGASSWELDALEPSVLESLVTNAIEGVIKWELWNEAKKRQQAGRDKLQDMIDEL
jgi:hypothetical protein